MSRIGNRKIEIPAGVTVEENERLNAERKEYERLVNFEKDILYNNTNILSKW